MVQETPKDKLRGPSCLYDLDPLHPDDFEGSDEESHYMSSTQGMKGLDYGVSPAQTKRIMTEAGITEDDAKELHAKMVEAYPAMARYADTLNAELSHTGLHILKARFAPGARERRSGTQSPPAETGDITMSEGVENLGPRTEAEYWSERWHVIADALVTSGIAGIDVDEYERTKARMLTEGWALPQAATIAFNLGKARLGAVSACEVNPW